MISCLAWHLNGMKNKVINKCNWGPFFMYYERNSLSYRKCIPITRQSMVCVHLTNWSIIRKKCRKFVKTLLLKRNAKCVIRWVNSVYLPNVSKFLNTFLIQWPWGGSGVIKKFEKLWRLSFILKGTITSNKTFKIVLSWIPELCCLSSFSV